MICPSSASHRPSLRERAQGKPGANCTRSLVCKMKKQTSIVTTSSADTHRLSPLDGLNGVLRALPGEAAFVATVIGRIPPANLTPRSRRQDHTTLPYAAGDF